MNVTIKYVQEIERRYGKSSTRDLGELLQVAATSISRYRNGSKGFADDVAIRAAQLLDLDPAVVLAELQQERAPDGIAKAAWSEILGKLRAATTAATVILTMIIASLVPQRSEAHSDLAFGDNVHYVKCDAQKMAGYARRLQPCFAPLAPRSFPRLRSCAGTSAPMDKLPVTSTSTNARCGAGKITALLEQRTWRSTGNQGSAWLRSKPSAAI